MTVAAELERDILADHDVTVLTESRTRPERFEVLFDAYYPEIHRYAHSRLGADLADDVASETFLVAFWKRDRFAASAGNGSVRAWLYGIATNLIRRHRRNEERKYRALARSAASGEERMDGHDEQVAARVSAQAVHRDLATALAALPARDRDVLLLVALGGLDYAETATALGIPYGTVCSRLNRARRRIRATFGADPTKDGLDVIGGPTKAPGREQTGG